jgi:hypothetical protein
VTAARRAPRRFWPAAAIVIVVLGAGLAMKVTSGGSTGSPRPDRRSPAPAASGTSIPQLPRVSPAGLRWSGYHGVQLPSSPAAGPYHTANGVAWGFADTPLGALLAALNIAVRANAQWGPDVFVPTIRGQVTGPEADALLASCQADYGQASPAAHVTGGQPLGSAHVTEEAFRWAGWSQAARPSTWSAPGRAARASPSGHLPGSRSPGRAGTGGSSPRPAVTGATPLPS